MKRYSFHIAFGLGALAVLWVAAAVATSHLLVLIMSAVIAGVYVFGAIELHHYRLTTAALSQALAQIPPQLENLQDWLMTLPSGLQNPIRQRVEGERVGLPGPALTPYLVGLLVMLGMLGTFLGMVVTLNGAVFALEGSTNVAGIRAAFSEPIKGLGLAFGTSVAGVATSAMLGLMSSLARRERALASQQLDTLMGSSLRGFSLVHQRQETFKALQQQSQALPQVVQQLQTLMAQMAENSQQMHERLLANQQSFHSQVHSAYTGLAQSVDQSLRSSLSQSMQLASDGIRPVVQATMTQLSEQAQSMNERLLLNTQQHMGELQTQMAATAATVAQTSAETLTRHEQASTHMTERVGQTLDAFSQNFERSAQSLLDQVSVAQTQQLTLQSSADQQRLQAWQASLTHMASELHSQWQASGTQTLAQQQAICDTLGETAQAIQTHAQTHASQTLADITRLHDERTAADQARLDAWQASLTATASNLDQAWQNAGAQTLAQQQAICDTLTRTAQEITAQTQTQATQTLADITRLMASSEALMRERIATEAQWTAGHQQRAEELAAMLRQELSALRDAEDARGQTAVARLSELQSVVTAHLTTLGTALEDPITRLIETASEAPKAAAEVIGQLRQEISVSVARDNALLEERTRILGTLSTLLDAINHASTEQRSVIDTMVTASQATLSQTSGQFQAHVAAETDKLVDIAAQVTASAVDVASLGETFGFAVRSFSDTNDKLMINLQRIEQAIEKSMTRSDEQLAYYVAQAREMIDLSIGSQKDVLEALQQRQAEGAA
ncbi:DUF802 domain-containing protein [Limnohabitans sp. G3-2]|uniref:DUF802 domain-containing protein n=1 Tax=Limnohabitans sp. G3-2 TaxID=1100711 RepID=UPI000C1E678D|nr:DUF802 domain-containing protein [Limnohabitans sp. G3-2]PIT75027.1 hypothetical protein B9Z31_08225 [Limnohabitans sp. G3-2]